MHGKPDGLELIFHRNPEQEIVAVPVYHLARVLMSRTAAVLEVSPQEINFRSARDPWLMLVS